MNRHSPFCFLILMFFVPNGSGALPLMDIQDGIIVSKNTAAAEALSGDFEKALATEKNALNSAEDRFGPIHPCLAPILIDIATLERALALYPQAEADLRWALALREKNFGLEAPLIAETLDQLAALDSDLGRFEEAQQTEKKAVNIAEKNGITGAPFAQILFHLGRIQLDLQDPSEALDFFEKALHTNQSSDALNLEILFSESRAYLALQQPSQALSSLHQALDLSKKPGFSVPQQADALIHLADLETTQGSQKEANDLYQLALKLLQPYVGISLSYNTLPYLSRLAAVEKVLGNDGESLKQWQNAVSLSQSTFGASHPQTALFQMDLAMVQAEQGDKASAVQNLKSALKTFQTFYDPGHPLIQKAKIELKKLDTD